MFFEIYDITKVLTASKESNIYIHNISYFIRGKSFYEKPKEIEISG